MDVDKECSAMGALFQQIITDMKVGAPLWDDFLSKASKLHTALKSTLSVIAAYLDAFQKIADSATNAKGATKDIGTVLTRICLRHKAVEARLKTFSSALMECLVLPLQDKLEEWKKFVVNLDKEHSKEYKKVRADIKKRTAEAQRWQKKAKKIRSGVHGGGGGGPGAGAGGPHGVNALAALNERTLNAANQELLRAADAAQVDLNSRLALLQETEKQALRSALIEERSRFCLFVACLKPVMSEEMAMMTELSHLEGIITQLDKHTADPFSLPLSTEQMMAELKGSAEQSHWTLQTPPSSPSSLGSRKSSMCSLGSIHSSSSGSVASHNQNQMHSPSHAINHGHPIQHIRHRSLSQVAHGVGVRLSSVSSQDSGFTSQDTLVLRPNSSPPSNQLAQQVIHSDYQVNSESASRSECSSSSSSSSTPISAYPPGGLPKVMATATWPNLKETIQYDRSANTIVNERPHTISTAYEKGHQRAALSVYTFQPLEHSGQSCSNDKFDRNSTPTEPCEYETLRRCRELKATGSGGPGSGSSQESLTSGHPRPPLPQRCSSLERPSVPGKSKEKLNKKNSVLLISQDDSALAVPDFHLAAPDMIVPQPVYMNANELRQSSASNGDLNDPGHTIYSSLASCTVYDDSQACSCHGPTREWRPPISSRPVLRRPASFSGYADPSAMTSMDWGLRGSVRMSTMKRTSIPSFATLHEVNIDEIQLAIMDETASRAPESMGPTSVEDIDLAALPPPPDFLLDSLIVDTTGGEDNANHSTASTTSCIGERSLSVAAAVKTLNEIRHQPASPGVIRRAQSMRVANLNDVVVVDQRLKNVQLQQQQHQQHQLKGLLAKGVGTMPKVRRNAEQGRQSPHGGALQHHSSTKTLPKHLPSHPDSRSIERGAGDNNSNNCNNSNNSEQKVVSELLSKSSFVNTLNAKLALQQHAPDSPATAAQRMRQHLVDTVTIVDPMLHHESLMDQIRRGTSLRRARSTNDRSLPKI